MRSAYVALALRVSKNLALALAPISASAERNVRSVQVCLIISMKFLEKFQLTLQNQIDIKLVLNILIGRFLTCYPISWTYLARCSPWRWPRVHLCPGGCARARIQPRVPTRAPRCQTCRSFCQWKWLGHHCPSVQQRNSTFKHMGNPCTYSVWISILCAYFLQIIKAFLFSITK